MTQFTVKRLRRRTELKPKIRCSVCNDLLLIGESGLVCGRAHGRIQSIPAGTTIVELRRLFPDLAIEHPSMNERLANVKGAMR